MLQSEGEDTLGTYYIVSSSLKRKGQRRSGKVPLRNDIKTEICNLTTCFARFRKGKKKNPTGRWNMYKGS